MRSSLFSSLLLAGAAIAAEVTYNWEATWVTAAPDGKPRPVIGINNAWPCPKIEANLGDTVIVNLRNRLGNQTTGLHFHGINQINTHFMDGPSGVTQCPVPPDSSITYKFVCDAAGTYWYHSHNMGQYPDGLRGPMIIHDPNDPYKGTYDEEIIVTLSDWYHNQSIDLARTMISPSNVKFQPPIPNGLIVNEGLGAKYSFVKGKTYRFRFINFAALGSVMVHFDSHTMQVIMNDASYIQKKQAYQLRISSAQRYDVLISAIDRDSRNYPFLLSLDINRDWKNDPPAQLKWPYNVTGQLVMDPNGAYTQDVVEKWAPVEDSHFAPLDNAPAFEPVSRTIVLDFDFCRDVNNFPRACFNNQTYIFQKVPTMYSVATTGEANTNPAVYGAVLPFVLKLGDVVELVVNNLDAAIHPFHLHGHQFQVLERRASNAGRWTGRAAAARSVASPPPRRDTVNVDARSFAVLRFRVDHPGVFLFHCHVEWHVEMGLTATFIEAPEMLRGLTFPPDHLDNCRKLGIPVSGNAAGNAEPNNTAGFRTVPPTTYFGALYQPNIVPT